MRLDKKFQVLQEPLRLKLDTRNRINLTKLLSHVKIHFVLGHREENTIVLELVTDIPTRELWLHQNPEALEAVRIGLTQAKEGDLVKRE